MKFLLLLAGLSSLAISGCTGYGVAWHKSGVDTDQWAADRAHCRSLAHREAAEDYHAGFQLGPPSGVNNRADYAALMDRHDAQRNAQTLYERCLWGKGYRRHTPKSKTTRST